MPRQPVTPIHPTLTLKEPHGTGWRPSVSLSKWLYFLADFLNTLSFTLFCCLIKVVHHVCGTANRSYCLAGTERCHDDYQPFTSPLLKQPRAHLREHPAPRPPVQLVTLGQGTFGLSSSPPHWLQKWRRQSSVKRRRETNLVREI